MKKKKDDIVLDLGKENETNDDVKGLSEEEQAQIKNISEKIRQELGLQEQEEKAAESVSGEEEPNDFFKKYSKKEEVADSGSFGKYNSDLDFKLNKKIKKVHLPLTKKAKILLSTFAGVFVVALGVMLGVLLYKPPVPITLSSVALSQPQDGTKNYIVYNNHLGDKLGYDTIYLNCNYSDGSTKRIQLQRDMFKVLTANAVDRDLNFIKTGNVDVEVTYGGNKMKLRYVVEKNEATAISVFVANPNANKIYAAFGTTSIDLSKKLLVNVAYRDGTVKNINPDLCTYHIPTATNDLPCENGILTLPAALETDHEYAITISYTENYADGSHAATPLEVVVYLELIE